MEFLAFVLQDSATHYFCAHGPQKLCDCNRGGPLALAEGAALHSERKLPQVQNRNNLDWFLNDRFNFMISCVRFIS